MINIIVATDFSETANNAMEYAIAAAKDINASIIVFHLFKLSSHMAHAMISTKALDEYLLMKKNEYEKRVAKVSEAYNIKMIPVVKMGDFLPEVQQVIEEYDAQLLVMGMPKKTIEQELLGNTTTSAIYTLKFPILSIPQGVKYNGIGHIIYACDLKRGIHATILQRVKEYATKFGAMVEVLHVGNSDKKIEAKYTIDREFDGIPYYYNDVTAEGVVKAIIKEAKNVGADMIIMTPHRYGFWGSLFNRTKTRSMVSNGEIPLLSIAY
jgi:nucleotide-binding universal stress UspA family protein